MIERNVLWAHVVATRSRGRNIRDGWTSRDDGRGTLQKSALHLTCQNTSICLLIYKSPEIYYRFVQATFAPDLSRCCCRAGCSVDARPAGFEVGATGCVGGGCYVVHSWLVHTVCRTLVFCAGVSVGIVGTLGLVATTAALITQCVRFRFVFPFSYPLPCCMQ